MTQTAKSIRAFIGAKDYNISRQFYKDLGFAESILSQNMSYFSLQEGLGFYLQDAYVKDWVDNSMIFLEVANVDAYYEALQLLALPEKYEGVKVIPVRIEAWGKECFLHDPAGVLWHFGEFN